MSVLSEYVKKHGDTTGLFGGETVFITYEGVTTTARFVSGIQGHGYMVELHGTDKLICVPGYTITKVHPETGEKPLDLQTNFNSL